MKIDTMAKKVQDDLKKEIPEVYPQRYVGYTVNSVNYNVILSDIETYWNTEARFREGFSADDTNKVITIPNFFTKVNGIHKNRNEYINFIKKICESSNTMVMKYDTFLQECNELFLFMDKFSKNKKYSYLSDFNYDLIDWTKVEDCVEPTIKNILSKKLFCFRINNTKDLSFEYLTSDKKKLVIDVMVKTLKNNPCNMQTMSDVCLFMSAMLNMNMKYINLLNNFDYSFAIPKIVVLSENISKVCATFLYAMNEMGFDIIILSPNGKSNIEKYLDINELSLGYFDGNFDIEKETKSDAEIKAEKDKRKLDRRKQNKRKIQNFIEFLQIKKNVICLITTLLFIVSYLFDFSGTIKTVIQIFGIFFVLGSLIFFMDSNDQAVNSFTISFHVLLLIALGVILLTRGFLVLYSEENNPQSNTYTKSGFQVIEEEPFVCENGFVIHQKKDAVCKSGTYNILCYIENNANNSEEVVFEIWIGNNVIYRSKNIEPLTYTDSIYISSILPKGDHEVMVKYFNPKTYSPALTTNIPLGMQSMTIHVFTDEELEKEPNPYGYELK